MNPQDKAFLKEQILELVVEQVKQVGCPYLACVAEFPMKGIEAQFQAYAIDALVRRHLFRAANPAKGADLLLTNGQQIEVKGSTNMSCNWILSGLFYGTPCLFLACGGKKNGGAKISAGLAKLEAVSEMVGYERFVVGDYEWVIGLIARTGEGAGRLFGPDLADFQALDAKSCA